VLTEQLGRYFQVLWVDLELTGVVLQIERGHIIGEIWRKFWGLILEGKGIGRTQELVLHIFWVN